jgi:hypothetical protein
MLEMSDTEITVVAEQATHDLGIVAMIYMKAKTFAAGSVGFAYGAFSVLRFQHFGVSAKRQSVVAFKAMILETFWVFLAPLAPKFGSLFKIIFSPPAVVFARAFRAAIRQALKLSSLFVELLFWFYLFASLTTLHSFRGWKARRFFVVGNLPCDLARFAISVEAVRLGTVFVKFSGRFRQSASAAEFLHGVLLPASRGNIARFAAT